MALVVVFCGCILSGEGGWYRESASSSRTGSARAPQLISSFLFKFLEPAFILALAGLRSATDECQEHHGGCRDCGMDWMF